MTFEKLDAADYLNALLALPKLWGGSVSPDGKWVGWNWLGGGSAMDVYAAPSDGSAAPVRLTNTGEFTRLVSWVPGQNAVIVAHDRGGNERLELFRVNLDTPTVLHPLTEANPNYYIRGGQLHPNGKWLIYGANRDPNSGAEIEQSLVYRHDLESGEQRALAKPEKGCWYIPRLNKAGTHILYNRKDNHPAGYTLWVVDIDGHEDREVVNVGDDRKVYGSWLPDSTGILVLAEAETHYKVGLWRLADGALEWLIDDPARNIESVYVPHGSSEAVIVEVQDARTRASLYHLETRTERRLPNIPGNLTPIAPLADGMWVGSFYRSNHPSDLVRFSPDDCRPDSFVSLTRVQERTILKSDLLASAEDFRWKSVDGLTIQGWLYRPRETAKGTIVYVHGGPTHHSSDALDDQIQFFVSQGFNVLDPNYRGSTGFSRAYQEAIKVDGWGGREQEDIRTGIEALITTGIAERGKVGITGTSYGGYSSWHAITHFPPETLAAAAPICGMTDLVVDYETTRPDLRPYSEEMLGGRPDQVPERYYERSPINFVGNIRGHLLIIQGLQDPNVTPENVRAVRAALDKAGIEHQLLAFEDEGHGIDRPENQKVMYQRLVDFFSEAFAANA
ncbi:MAG: S9 family peptidase [Anaerolineae bacterium]|nr:S9 family peptidase [Anaerolineae bacterium]